MHAADDTPSKNSATRARHCNFMRQGGVTSQCSSRVEEERPVAATAEVRSEGNGAEPEHGGYSCGPKVKKMDPNKMPKEILTHK